MIASLDLRNGRGEAGAPPELPPEAEIDLCERVVVRSIELTHDWGPVPGTIPCGLANARPTVFVQYGKERECAKDYGGVERRTKQVFISFPPLLRKLYVSYTNLTRSSKP